MASLRDPLGREIQLTDGAWFGHIVKGHPEMRGLRAQVESAISSPTAIHQSTSDADCRLYYGASTGARLIICVVVDVAAGFVKTAYLTRRVKPGAKEWPPQRP